MKKIVTSVLTLSLATLTCATYADTAHKKTVKHTQTVSKKHIASKKTVKKHYPNVESTSPNPEPEDSSGPIAGNFSITSNYMNRGVSQSNNLPAIQGSLTYTFLTTGIYFNIWGSNVDFPVADGSTATLEIDALAGIANTIGDHFTYNLAYAHYHYPKASLANYDEAIADVSFYFLTGKLAYSANEFNVHAPGWYYNGGVKFDLPAKYVYFEDVQLAATAGHYILPPAAGRSYNDYAVSLSKQVKSYNLALMWTNTNHKFSGNSLDASHVVGTVTASF